MQDPPFAEPRPFGQAPRYRYQLDNHLGTVAVEVDEAGSVISYEEYHPYGTTAYRAEKNGIEVSARRYRYTGKERDEETGLYYHGARYYAPWLGRWTAADPSGVVDGVNLYGYCRGNPVGMRDPDGRDPNPFDDPIARRLWATVFPAPPKLKTLTPTMQRQSDSALSSERNSSHVSSSLDKGDAQNFSRFDNYSKANPELSFKVRAERWRANHPGDVVHNDKEHTVAANVGGGAVIGVTPKRLEAERGKAHVERKLKTLSNLAGGPGAAAGYLGARAVSDDPDVADRASDVGAVVDDTAELVALGSRVLGPATRRQLGLSQTTSAPIGRRGHLPKIRLSGPGTYVRTRILPVDKQGVPIPDVDVPHTQLGRSRPKFGFEPQAVEWDYGSNGNLQPMRVIDFSHHGYPSVHPDPHQHKLTPNNPRLAPKGGYRRGTHEPL